MTKEQFLKCCKRKENGCLIWIYGGDGNGYGAVYYKGRKTGAHRLALHLWTGFDIDSPLEVLHDDAICTSKRCCEYTHLRPGNEQENASTVTKRNYNSEKTHCKRGHKLSGSNVYNRGTYRQCVICTKVKAQESYRRKKLQGRG